MRTARLLLSLLATGLLCAPVHAQAPDAPAAAPAQAPALPAGVELRELERDGQTVWLYLPKSGAPSALVVVPPAGGTLLTAPPLTLDDRPEHFPYVEKGLAVVSFSLSGTLTGNVTREQVRTALADFAKSRGNVLDAQKAIAVALAEVPALEGKPIFAAGFSSAAGVVLALAAEDPRIRAVAAFATVADAPKFVEGNFLRSMADNIPGTLDVTRELTPLRTVQRIQVPVFLFHAEDDETAPVAGTRELVRVLTESGNAPQLRIAKSGGHTDAFLSEGLPAGVSWLGEQLQPARR